MKKKLGCVLLVDDDLPTNFLNRVILEEAGCADCIQIAQSGQDALDFLQKAGEFSRKDDTCPTPALIFLDINMPAMDGWEFLSRYNALKKEQQAGIIIVMLTTSLNPEDELKARTIPAVSGFQCKPLTPKVLDNLLGTYFPDYL
ncbi:MAG TPA: response regulator [Chitinophagaceae bacterium]|jgi:CheY-like chemotaxis protein